MNNLKTKTVFCKAFLSLLFLSVLIIIAGCSSDNDNEASGDEKITIKYSHGTNPSSDDPHHWVAETFKEKVEEYTDGQAEVEIYPAGQIGSEARGFQDVQNQVVQASSLAVNNAQSYSPTMGIFDLPYLFDDRDEFYQTIDEYWDEFNDNMIKNQVIEQ